MRPLLYLVVLAVLAVVSPRLGAAQQITGRAPPLSYLTSTSVSVATTSTLLVPAAAYSSSLQVCTLPGSTTNVWLNASGGAATVDSGIPVFAGGGCTTFGTGALPIPTGPIYAITDGGSAQTVVLSGG